VRRNLLILPCLFGVGPFETSIVCLSYVMFRVLLVGILV